MASAPPRDGPTIAYFVAARASIGDGESGSLGGRPRRAGLGDHLELNGVDPVDPGGGVQDLERDQAAGGVVVEDHARFLLRADPGVGVPQDHAQRVGPGVVGDLHGFAVRRAMSDPCPRARAASSRPRL